MRRAKPTVIDLRSLSEKEMQFWQRAKKAYRENADWMVFENLVFNSNSPFQREEAQERG